MFLSLTLAHHAPRIPSSTSCGSFRSSSLGPRFPLEQWKYRTERVVFGVQERSKRGRVLGDLCRLGLIFGAYWGYVATLAFFFFIAIFSVCFALFLLLLASLLFLAETGYSEYVCLNAFEAIKGMGFVSVKPFVQVLGFFWCFS